MGSLGDLTPASYYHFVVKRGLIFDSITFVIFELESGINVDKVLSSTQLFNHDLALLVICASTLAVEVGLGLRSQAMLF